MKILMMLIVSVLVIASSVVTADCPPCGPTMCLNDPQFAKALIAKKAKMKGEGATPDLIALLDRDGACMKQITEAPTVFTILSVTSNGSSTIVWDANEERIARNQLLNGTTIAYYKFNVRQRFACCGETPAAQRPDWDPQLELSRSLSIKCV